MRAIAIDRYGGPEVLELRELPTPKVGPDVVLVRARAAGVNPVDTKTREGGLDGRFPAHFPLIPGWDVAGTVEAVGPDVTEFAPGDEVIGYVRRDHVQWGTYAEYVAAPIRTVAPKPAEVGWAEAAALPLAGLTAWQALTRGLKVGHGDVVLVHAAAGGVGSFAVQLARLFGATVIGTASEGTHDYLRSLGAEPVAYGAGLVERVRALAPDGVTAALDLVGGDALEVSPQLLATGGRIASVLDPKKTTELGGRYIFVRPDPSQLAELSRLVDDGRLTVRLERTFPLDDAAGAQRLIEAGHVHGKLALEIG
ncbi:MAG: NADP-dependent oxidoreductase [Actinomycetota bacterium]|nr:NADP-dependent oxidoreductase [Actinomycetota bacterium]